MNKGDTVRLILNYKVNNVPIQEDEYDEIELQLNPQSNSNSIKFLKKDMTWDSELEKYTIMLSQENTFKLKQGSLNEDSDIDYQLRILESGCVVSSDIGTFTLGPVLSKRVLEVENNGE